MHECGAHLRSMGNNGTKGQPQTSPLIRQRSRSVVERWSQRQLHSQLCALVRHAERADDAWAENSDTWVGSEDFHRWPIDPPLSAKGLETAQSLPDRLRNVAEGAGADTYHVVVSSPYFRCIQTAVEICRGLGPQVPLLIDWELGEIYGPSVMGDREPVTSVRPFQRVKQYCASKRVNLRPKPVGRWPQWPEEVNQSRSRFVQRFLRYVHRSSTARRNFIIVTHADAVAAGLSVIPSCSNKRVEKVEYAGLFAAWRSGKAAADAVSNPSTPSNSKAGTPSNSKAYETKSPMSSMSSPFSGISKRKTAPVTEDFSDCVMPRTNSDVSSPTSSPPTLSPSLASCQEECSFSASMDDDTDCRNAFDVTISEGWKVSTHGILTHTQPNKPKNFGKRMMSWTKGSTYSWSQIERLLGALPAKPIGVEDLTQPTERSSFYLQTDEEKSQQEDLTRSSCSLSTYLFGASEVGSRMPTEMSILTKFGTMTSWPSLPGSRIQTYDKIPSIANINDVLSDLGSGENVKLDMKDLAEAHEKDKDGLFSETSSEASLRSSSNSPRLTLDVTNGSRAIRNKTSTRKKRHANRTRSHEFSPKGSPTDIRRTFDGPSSPGSSPTYKELKESLDRLKDFKAKAKDGTFQGSPKVTTPEGAYGVQSSGTPHGLQLPIGVSPRTKSRTSDPAWTKISLPADLSGSRLFTRRKSDSAIPSALPSPSAFAGDVTPAKGACGGGSTASPANQDNDSGYGPPPALGSALLARRRSLGSTPNMGPILNLSPLHLNESPVSTGGY